jgi:hypothetical protein
VMVVISTPAPHTHYHNGRRLSEMQRRSNSAPD